MPDRRRYSPYLGAKPRRRSLRWDLCASTSDGVGFSAMVGLGESYFPAFVLALGLSQVLSGQIGTLPMLAGAVIQLITPLGVRWARSWRTWAVACAAVQTLNHFVLAASALWWDAPAWAVFALAAVHYGSGLCTGPAWTTWITFIVPRRIRAHYFARRNRPCQVGTLAGLMIAGAVLSLAGGPTYVQKLTDGTLADDPALRRSLMTGFAIIFSMAGLARLISTVLLALQSEPRPIPHVETPVSTADLIARVGHSADGKLLAYAGAMAVAINIAQPFFNPYLRVHLRFSEDQCGVLLATAFLGRIVALPWLGRQAARFGPRRVLVLGGVLLVPVTVLWTAPLGFWYFVAAQLLAGAALAAHEYGVLMLTFETMPEHERTSIVTKNNVLNALATAAGSVIGGWILGAGDENRSAYGAAFVASAAARLLALGLLARVPRANRPNRSP